MKKIIENILMFFAIIILTMACANDEVGKNKENKTENKEHAGIVFQSGEATRTLMDHEINGPGKFFWEVGDNIWVNNGGSYIPSSSSDITEKTAFAKFYFSSGALTATEYPITYTGKGSSKGNEVTIKNVQTQSQPGNFNHLGTSGDCGTATAKKIGNIYHFSLQHQAAYLCFQPRSSNAYVQHSKLIKIEVISDKDIAGTYTLSNTGLSTAPTSGASKTITLNTNEFNLDNSTADLSKNGSYMVIAPGNHKLTIKYWLRNTVDPSYIYTKNGTITQDLTINVEAGKIYDITADLKIPEFGNDFYMWDARYEYWADLTPVGGTNYKQYQPKVEGVYIQQHPKVPSDLRWYSGAAFPTYASRTCKDCPNVNELRWYVEKGDPHGDQTTMWLMDGRLYAGGMWFKKQSVIAAENPGRNLKTSAPNGINYTVTGINGMIDNFLQVDCKRPTAATIKNYFFLPVTGNFYLGGWDRSTSLGVYWSSTPYPNFSGSEASPPNTSAYYLDFYIIPLGGYGDYAAVRVMSNARYQGFRRFLSEDDYRPY